MNKKMLLALLLAMVMALTGCALIEKDPEVDAARIALTIDDVSYTKGELQAIVDQYYAEMSTYYSYFNMTFDKNLALDQTVDMLTEEQVLLKKAKEYGVSELTEEDKAKVQEKAMATYESDMEIFAAQNFGNAGMTGAELVDATTAWMESNGYSFDSYVETEFTALRNEKIKAAALAEIALSDAEIQAEYDLRVADAMENYEEKLEGYGVYVNYEQPVYYRPEGYRYVKQIKRTFDEADQAIIKDLDKQIDAAESEISSANSSLTALAEAETPDEAKKAELETQKADAEAKLTDLQAQKQAAIETACANILPKMNEIAGKLAAGEDFDALVEKYGEDPYMLESPMKENGYAVCSESTMIPDELFAKEAMALAKVGDISEPILATNGMAIMLYVADEVAGPVDFDAVKDTIHDELLADKQDEAYAQLVDQWVSEAKVKLDRKVLAD